MSLARNQRYDVALDNQGFVLFRNPEAPSISAKQEQIFNLRYNQGDHDYNDLSKYWYWAQTDWSSGFKDTVQWADDAKFYYSTNIDPFVERGAFKLSRAPELQHTFSDNILCGTEGTVNNASDQYVGSAKGTKAVVYKNAAGSWTDISSATFTTNPLDIVQLNTRLNYLWSHAVGDVAGGWVVAQWDGTTWSDQSALIGASITFANSRCALTYSDGRYFVFVDDAIGHKWGLVSCTKTLPTLAADWTVVLNKTATTNVPVACAVFNGKIYYLLLDNATLILELRVFNPGDSTDVNVTYFRGVDNTVTFITTSNWLQVMGGELIITVPNIEVWAYNGSTFTRLYLKDPVKQSIGQEAYALLTWGGVIANNRFYSGNLVSDLTSLYNYIKDAADTSASDLFLPLFSDSSNNIWGIDTVNKHKLYEVKFAGTVYKGAAGKNFLVFNNYDKISGVDKLAYYCTVIFSPLASGQTLTVEYTTDNVLTSTTTWTTLGTISYAVDGSSITQKNLYFGDGVVYKKIWIRVKQDGNTTNTPSVYDAVMAYLPWPDHKLHWSLVIKAEDQIRRKDGSLEPKTGVWLKNYLRNSWLKKSIMTYEDFDLAMATLVTDNPLSASATTINVGSTDNFPEFGRLLIESEEIFYSGKTKTSFLNCTRGVRDTNAVSHVANTTVSVAFRVVIHNYTEELMIANDPTKAEYIIHLELIES